MNAGKLAIVILCTGLACSAPRTGVAPARPAWPSTPAAATARAFIETYNSGDRDAMLEFETEHRLPSALESRSPEELVRMWIDNRERWGRFEPAKIRGDVADRISVLVHTATSDEWFELAFELQTRSPHKLLSIGLGTAAPLPATPVPEGLRR